MEKGGRNGIGWREMESGVGWRVVDAWVEFVKRRGGMQESEKRVPREEQVHVLQHTIVLAV